jgi:predicted small integral membrane protein
MTEPLAVLDARSRPLGASVTRWLSVGAVLYGGAGFVHLAAGYVLRAMRHPGGMFPLSVYDVNVAAIVVAACCWIAGGIGLLRGHRFAPRVLKVAAGLWLAAMTWGFVQFEVDNVVVRSTDPWYARVHGATSHLAYYATHCFFALAVLVALRHPEVRATFSQPTGGFLPILDAERHTRNAPEA